MNVKNILIVGGAALAVFMLMRQFGQQEKPVEYWAVEQGNTGYPAEAMTGGLWV